MGKSTRGYCKYCGKEYTRTGMVKHLQTCKRRVDLYEKATETEKYFELLLYGAYNKDYWLIIQIKENATLDDLDQFIRDIWVECCGHLSAFEINGVSYEKEPDDDFCWDEPAESTEHKLKEILESDMLFGYEYDFGSTTELAIKVLNYEFAILRIGYRGYGEEGTLNADEKFEQNMENARKAGIDVGVYFFSQAVNEEEAKEEADFVLEHLKGQELQMPVVYDPEHILEDEARTDDVTGEQFTQNAKVFCKEIEKAGYDAMIYSNMLWEAYELDLEKLLDYPVWYADYEELPQTPYRFSMWQYSSTGSVAGIEGMWI